MRGGCHWGAPSGGGHWRGVSGRVPGDTGTGHVGVWWAWGHSGDMGVEDTRGGFGDTTGCRGGLRAARTSWRGGYQGAPSGGHQEGTWGHCGGVLGALGTPQSPRGWLGVTKTHSVLGWGHAGRGHPAVLGTVGGGDMGPSLGGGTQLLAHPWVLLLPPSPPSINVSFCLNASGRHVPGPIGELGTSRHTGNPRGGGAPISGTPGVPAEAGGP